MRQAAPVLRNDLFTDPACPFAFSHEPVRWRLRWLYGDALDWRPRMIGLADSVAEMVARGLTPALLARTRATLAERHGMPIRSDTPDRLYPTRLAALAVVGARHAVPDRVERLLRALRVLAMAGRPLDEPRTVAAAARGAGLRPGDVLEVVRYTAPSYVIHGPGRSVFAIPGFRPAETYTTAVANLLPTVTPRRPPESAASVLDWAGQPLAMMEVAAVLGVNADEARERLLASAAIHVAGYWTMQSRAPWDTRPA